MIKKGEIVLSYKKFIKSIVEMADLSGIEAKEVPTEVIVDELNSIYKWAQTPDKDRTPRKSFTGEYEIPRIHGKIVIAGSGAVKKFINDIKFGTGYDGIEKIFYNVGEGGKETWRHYVVWNKNQIKPMRPVNESYDFDYCCISPRSQKELDYIIDNMIEVSKEEFFKNIDVNDAIDGVASGVGVDYRQDKDPIGFIKRDWGNRYYKIDKKGIDAYILVNSGVEHIFRNTEIKPRASKSEPMKRIDKNVEYRGYKIGDSIKLGSMNKKIEDIVIHPNNQTQFYVDGYWRLADDLIDLVLKGK